MKEQGGFLLLGSDVTPGLIIVYPSASATAADLERAQKQGMQEQTVSMAPSGGISDARFEGGAGKVIEVAGTIEQTQVQGLLGAHLRAEGTGGVVILFVPPFFLMLGLIGAFFTTIGGLGWLDEKSRNPLSRAIRAVGGWLLQEKVLKPIFFVIVGGIVAGVAVPGIKEEQYLLGGVAAFIVWCVWRAARPHKRSQTSAKRR